MRLPVIVFFFAAIALVAAATSSASKSSASSSASKSSASSSASKSSASKSSSAATHSATTSSVAGPSSSKPVAKPTASKTPNVDRHTLLSAAVALSEALTKLHVDHAVIGGAACNLLGSKRATGDLDFVVGVPGHEVRHLKARVASTDKRFEQVGSGIRLKGHNFPIEMLPTDRLTWPVPLRNGVSSVNAKEVPGKVDVLSSAAIYFNKALRVRHDMSSTRPQTVVKVKTDLADMTFLHGITRAETFRKIFHMYPGDKQAKIAEAVKAVGQKYKNLANVAVFIHAS